MSVFDLEHVIDCEYQWLKEIVYRFICRSHNGAESCLTRHLLLDFNIYLDWSLRLSGSVDEDTFRSILGDLKSEGRIGHFWSNVDTWVPIPPTTQ